MQEHILLLLEQRFSNDLLFNWDKQSVPKSAKPSDSTFPLSYTTACFQVVSNLNLSSGDGMRNIGVSSVSKTKIEWSATYTESQARTGTIRWFAVGV